MINQAKDVYFIGIGGIGMSAVARLLLLKKKWVRGSDLRESETINQLRKLGAEITIGHSAANLTETHPDLIVYSEDISPESKGFVELKAALDLKIPAITYAKALGQMMSGQFNIAVSGTNGKSTTTAILSLILEEAGFDPTVVVGSKLSDKNSSVEFQANARLGSGKYFVAEADEYHRHMMEIDPNMIVLTNIAEDHLDYYRDIQDIKGSFEAFIEKLPHGDGVVIYNADDHNSVEVARKSSCHKLTFGIHHYGDLQAVNVESGPAWQAFDMHYKDENLGRVELKVPGLFNMSNALAAALAAFRLGIDFKAVKRVLENFAGIWRRFELVGKMGETIIVSDYAHHPAAVLGTIRAAKAFFPGKKILFVFQPHHKDRTLKLMGEFIESLLEADNLLLCEIFEVAGREHGERVSSTDLVSGLAEQGMTAEYAKDLKEAETNILSKASQFDAIVLMGAGDIDSLARKLAATIKA
ncbi:MAG: UDP-N-acetylmuramate--L-alanine ligase [Acidobacteriaceae bacterium]